MTTLYEWDIETVDAESDDIIDHNHRDRLAEFGTEELIHAINEDTEPGGTFTRLVLVRDVGNDIEGLIDRLWCYVKDGELPEYFSDSLGGLTAIRVPKRFIAEFNR